MCDTAFTDNCKPETTISRTVPRMETIKITAKICGVPEYLVRRKVLSGEVVAICSGRRYLVNVDKFLDYLNSNKLSVPDEQGDPTEHNGIRPIPTSL